MVPPLLGLAGDKLGMFLLLSSREGFSSRSSTWFWNSICVRLLIMFTGFEILEICSSTSFEAGALAIYRFNLKFEEVAAVTWGFALPLTNGGCRQ